MPTAENVEIRRARSESWWRRKLRHLLSSDSQLESEELVTEAVRSGATPIGEVSDRERVTVQGTISVVTLNPGERRGWLEADLTDGSGTVRLIWMGRRTIAGVDPGRRLRVEGLVNHNAGTAIIYNPRYKLLA